MEDFFCEIFPRIIGAALAIDLLMFLCGTEKTLTGWILDRLGL